MPPPLQKEMQRLGGRQADLISRGRKLMESFKQGDYASFKLLQTITLMDRARDWLGGTQARWNAHDHVWTFPSGASLTFGYLETERDKYRYQSSELQYIGFDELTQFGESQYLYLFSRLRRLAGCKVPLRMRSASNPGGLGHDL